MAVVPTVPLKKMGLDDKGYVEMNQMVLIFMRSQPDVPEEEVRGIEHTVEALEQETTQHRLGGWASRARVRPL